MAEKLYKIVQLDEIASVACPCGQSRRAFTDDKEQLASMHVVEIKADSRVHYHKKHTELYLFLEGDGRMELDGVQIPVKPYTSILIKAGCRHRAVGNLKIVNVAIPSFDPEDEWFD